MKVVTIIGARPQFIKAAVVSRVLTQRGVMEYVVHTGQHHDNNMSQIFFSQLRMQQPKINLQVACGGHGEMTGRMLIGIERVLLSERPDVVLVYGDTNSTLAGALAASKLHIPIAHVEAGLRSHNKRMPEEVNRVLTDHMSTWLFSPTTHALDELRNEGITHGVHFVGDVMYDACQYYAGIAFAERRHVKLVEAYNYVVLTLHRPDNVDDMETLHSILSGINEIAKAVQVVFPVHPRTRARISTFGLEYLTINLRCCEPVGYLEMTALLAGCQAVITDSGGLQKEAFFHRKQTITVRTETEWVETITTGWNRLCAASSGELLNAWHSLVCAEPDSDSRPYGDGCASERIVEILLGD